MDNDGELDICDYKVFRAAPYTGAPTVLLFDEWSLLAEGRPEHAISVAAGQHISKVSQHERFHTEANLGSGLTRQRIRLVLDELTIPLIKDGERLALSVEGHPPDRPNVNRTAYFPSAQCWPEERDDDTALTIEVNATLSTVRTSEDNQIKVLTERWRSGFRSI